MRAAYKIALLGIGGVGGYLGGLLAGASRVVNSEVIFICRGDNLNAIREAGLKLITDNGENTFNPDIATDAPVAIGTINLLLCCVKGFDLEQSLRGLAGCITENTIIIPLLNGINAAEKIKHIYPQAKVWKGTIYLVSRLIAPGVVRQSGPLNQLYFGSKEATNSELETIEKLFLKAGIKAQAVDNIDQKIWEKFFFISSMATITSYYNCAIGAIQTDTKRAEYLQHLLLELEHIATANRIIIAPTLREATFAKIKGLPPETATSMLNDFRKGGNTEIEELTGYVVALGRALRVPTPIYETMYNKLRG